MGGGGDGGIELRSMTEKEIKNMFKDYIGFIIFDDGTVKYTPLNIEVIDAPKGLLNIHMDLKKLKPFKEGRNH